MGATLFFLLIRIVARDLRLLVQLFGSVSPVLVHLAVSGQSFRRASVLIKILLIGLLSVKLLRRVRFGLDADFENGFFFDDGRLRALRVNHLRSRLSRLAEAAGLVSELPLRRH